MLCMPACSFKLGWRRLFLPALGVPPNVAAKPKQIMRPNSYNASHGRSTAPICGGRLVCSLIVFILFSFLCKGRAKPRLGSSTESGDCLTGLAGLVARCVFFLVFVVIVFLMHGKAQQPEKGGHFFQDTRAPVAPGRSWFDVKIGIASVVVTRVGLSRRSSRGGLKKR